MMQILRKKVCWENKMARKGLEIQEENHEQGNKFLSDCEVRKIITQRKQDDLKWLYNYDCDIVKQAVKDACKAYKAFFSKRAKKPKFKSKKHNKPSFYVDGWRLKIFNSYVKIPNCTRIKLYEKEILEMKSRGATKQEIDKYWKNFDLLMSRYTILLLDIITISSTYLT